MARWEIAKVTHGDKKFEVVGDLTSFIEVDQSILIEDSTANDAAHVVASVTFADPNTEIIVDDAVTDSTADGTITPLFKGDVVADFEFETSAGTKHLLTFTTKRQYRYDGTNSAWVDVSPRWSIKVATTGAIGSGEFEIEGDVTSEIKAGQTFVVEGSTDNDGLFTIDSATFDDPDTTLVMGTKAVNGDNDDGELVHEMTGDEDDMIDVLQGTDDSGTYVICTNNVNAPLYWSGSNDFAIAIAGQAITLTSFVKCKTLCELHGYMWMGNVETTATDKRIGVYSDTSDFFDYESGNAGSQLFTDGEGELLRLVRLGDFIVAYFNRSVHLISHVGGTALWKIDKHVSGVGPVSPRAIANIGPYHIFMGEEGFYLYDGTMLLRPVGDKTIAKTLRRDLSTEYLARAHAFVDPKLSEAYFTVPTGASTKKTYLLEYNISDISRFKWTVFDYANPPMSFGWYSRHNDLTWAGLQILKGEAYTWDVAAGGPDYNWSDSAGKKGVPTKVFGSGAYVYIYEPTMTDDNGVAIDSWRDTKSFTVPQDFESLNGRWQEIEVDLKGISCDILYSTNEGKTWTYALQEADGSDADAIILTSDWTTYKFFVDVVSKTFDVRLRNPDLSGGFSSRWLRVWVRPGGPS